MKINYREVLPCLFLILMGVVATVGVILRFISGKDTPQLAFVLGPWTIMVGAIFLVMSLVYNKKERSHK